MVLPPLGDDDLPQGWPQDHDILTLGPDVLAWAEEMLVQPDGDHIGDSWRWTISQARFVCWLYALGDDGTFLFHRGQVVLPKGAGKSPMAAALACIELAGPVIPDGVDAGGAAVGRPRPSPDVQIAAVSEEQAGNTMALAIGMLKNPEALRAIPGLDPGLTRVRTASGMLHAVTASATTREGNRSTFAVLDETHLWQSSNGGHRLFGVIKRNLGKMDGRSVETTNTWVPGLGSIAEKTFDNAMKQRAGLTDDKDRVLRWHPKAPVIDLGDRAAVRAALDTLYGDSPWVNRDRIASEIYDLDTDPREAMRFYLNIITEASDSWLAEPDIAGCADGVPPSDGDVIVMGFDGSRGRWKGKPDATALIGCTMDGATLFELGVWEAPENRSAWTSWQPPLADVEATIADAFERYDVKAFLCDPARDWRSHVNAWEARWGNRVAYKVSVQHPFEYWMTGGRSIVVERAIEALEGAFRNRDVHHLGEVQLVRHLLNARRRVSHGRLALGKESSHSDKKIDAAVAAVLAWQARTDALTAGLKTPQKPARVTFIPSRVR